MKQAVHGWLSTYERLVKSQNFFSSYLTQEDLSRFGRNYLQVGYYTEILFPKKGVRFIAINNNVDSATPQDNDFTPFLNIMNEWYAKDTSNKIKAIFKSRMKDGMRCSGSIPYGYKRKPDDKQTLIVDEPAAEVVRKIFRLVCQGNSTTAIAEMLTAEKVLIPSAYAALNQPKNCRHKNVADPYRWSATTVGYILDRQEYLGHTVLGKSICENFKTKQRRAATPDELMIFPDTHEAIIDQDTWDIARKIRSKKKPRVANGTYSHRLSGLVYCADCGARMGFISPEANHSEKHYDSDSAFQCGNYRSKSGECVSHYVKTSVLEAAILQAIQSVSKYVLENEDEFIQQLKAVWNEQQSRTANNGYQELAEAKKRMAALDEKINKLYESTLSGLLPERQAQRMIQQYDEEQILLERRVAELESLIKQDEIEQVDASRFIALVRKYRGCEELTDTMLYAFIDRIEVHEATGGRTIYRQQSICKLFHPQKANSQSLPTGRWVKNGFAEISPDVIPFVKRMLEAYPYYEKPLRLDDDERMQMDVVKEIYSFYPNILLEEIGEDVDDIHVKLLELPSLIEKYSNNPDNDTAYLFEDVLAEGFNMFVNVEARKIGGAGHTDIECLYITKRKKFAVEAKSTANKLIGINAGRLREHRGQIGGEYTMGYKRIITYTLESENGASLRASGWICQGKAGGLRWTGKRQPKEDQYPAQMKLRYEKQLRKEETVNGICSGPERS